MQFFMILAGTTLPITESAVVPIHRTSLSMARDALPVTGNAS